MQGVRDVHPTPPAHAAEATGLLSAGRALQGIPSAPSVLMASTGEMPHPLIPNPVSVHMLCIGSSHITLRRTMLQQATSDLPSPPALPNMYPALAASPALWPGCCGRHNHNTTQPQPWQRIAWASSELPHYSGNAVLAGADAASPNRSTAAAMLWHCRLTAAVQLQRPGTPWTNHDRFVQL